MRFLSIALMLAPALLADQQQPTGAEIQGIIEKFAAKEAEFARARENYTYRQSVKIEEVDEGGGMRGGKYEMVFDVIFTDDGKRTERVVNAPVTTLKHILMTPEDEQDLRNVQPFVLTTKELPEYHVRYLGRQKVDEIPAYVFAIKPKKMEKGERYFQGMVWVDDRDLQIIKTYGRAVGLTKKDQQFPKFETYREQIDGKYWFPTWTGSDDTLQFESGPQQIRMRVRYDNYKQFKSESQIKYGEPVEPAKPVPERRP